MYRLVVSDLDGTLLKDDETLSEYTKEVIQNISRKGVEFMIATGRIFGGAKRYAKELNLKTPILACNGALIKDVMGKLIYGNPIPPTALTEIFEVLTERELYFHSYGEDSFFTEKISGQMSRLVSVNRTLQVEDRIPLVEIDPMDLAKKETVYKVFARCSGEKSKEELYNRLTEIPGVAVTSSWQDSFDINAQQVSKGMAVEKYAAERGIDPSEIICFGDNFNDMEMIRFAGLGIATGNCVEPLKDVADYVTAGNNEDGVAKAIEKFVL